LIIPRSVVFVADFGWVLSKKSPTHCGQKLPTWTIVTTVVIARGSEIMVARDVPWYFPNLKEELG